MKSLFLVFVCFISSLGYTQLKPDVIFTKGHSELIITMTISSNGRFLASSAVDKEIIIWDMARGMEFRSIIGMDGRVNQLSFSSNNIHLAGASSSNELFVWDVITGKEILKKEIGTARGMGFSKNGKQVYYSNTESQLEMLDITTGSIQILYDGYVTDLIIDNANDFVYVYNNYGHIIKIKGETGAIIQG